MPIRAASGNANNATPLARTHTVRRGDNLSKIANRYGLSVDALMAENPQIKNRNLIHPGMALNLPGQGASAEPITGTGSAAAPAAPTATSGTAAVGAVTPAANDSFDGVSTYTVAPGDTLSRIANNHGVSMLNLLSANNIQNPNRIDVGDTINVPGAGSNGDAAYIPATALNNGSSSAPFGEYKPFSAEAKALFADAARSAGLPASWANSNGLHRILQKESKGKVGVPNYTYGRRASRPASWGGIHDELKRGRISANSSATGLGQLLIANVDRYYPSGRAGIGDPKEEAVGMLRYIKDRYGNPNNAWRLFGTRHEGY
jgi:LysM repeat protein